MKVILDNGHGENTTGKCSPLWKDGTQLREYEFNRAVVKLIAQKLRERKIDYEILVPEDEDISLKERCRRANIIFRQEPSFLISVHANASGPSGLGSGWSVWTSPGTTKSDRMATILHEEATKEFGEDWRMYKDYSDGDPDMESKFYILVHTACPAMLTENFFMDNEKDCRFIMSDEGRERIATMHVTAIEKIIKEFYGTTI